MPPRRPLDDREIVIITAAFVNAMDKQMYNATSFPRAEFAREIAAMRQAPDASVDVAKCLSALQYRILQLDSIFLVDGQKASLSVWDLMALARYDYEENRGA